jgi:integrase
MYSYSVFQSDPNTTAAKGFGVVSHIPCIFDSRPGYHRNGSKYLIDRALNAWSGNKSDRYSTPQTLRNIADWLVNFLEWAEVRKCDLLTASYEDDLLNGYQSDMQRGRWSKTGKPLKSSTINSRVDTACDYVRWMANEGLRAKLEVPYRTIKKTRNFGFNRAYAENDEFHVRNGKLPKDQTILRMPSDSEIRSWLEKINKRKGPTHTLLCESVLQTGIRRTEATSLRTTVLPEDPNDWNISNPIAPNEKQLVQIKIQNGTKGPIYGMDHGDKTGPSRIIGIPLHLALRWHEYRQKIRPIALKKWIRSSASKAEQLSRIKSTVHLFLDPKSGAPITSKDLYNAWTSVELPFKGWSPHKGRHWWACAKLWQEVNKYKLDFGHANISVNDSKRIIKDIISIHIQPQLGHIDLSTSEGYTRWAIGMLSEALPEIYQQELDSFPFENE